MGVLDDLGFPPELLAKVQLFPLEDFVLAILKPILEPYGFGVTAQIEDRPEFPFILVSRGSGLGEWGGDKKAFRDTAQLIIHHYTMDPDGSQKGAVFGEVVRALLYEAAAEHWTHPEFGTLMNIRMTMEPTRRPDWATSSGPVQYADLPTGAWRYESHFDVTIRPPRR